MQQVGSRGARAAVPLSVLDFGQLSAGQTSAQALADTTALAERADQLGYRRFWVSEHHAIPWLASTSPAVLLAHLASRTHRIRVGSGGVMLSNHAPLVVAEQFALLEALHPGRVDLGLGRAPGADPATADALRRTSAGLDGQEFAEQVEQVLAMLGLQNPATTDLHRTRNSISDPISPTPAAVSAPSTWLLGSSGYSAQLAGSLGLPYCFAAHNGAPTATVAAALDLYRQSFHHRTQHLPPTMQEGDPAPFAMVSVSVLAAETEHEVERLARPGRLQRHAERTGRRVMPLLSPEDAARVSLEPAEERAMAAMSTGGAAGTADHVVAALDQLTAATGADELLVCSFVHGASTRVRTLELLADAWQPHAATAPEPITV